MGPIRGTLVHGTAVALAVDPDGPLAGVLIEGPSGSGKSDLALRLMEACPWRRTRLVADDSVLVSVDAGKVMAACPQTIEGLIELRGVGISPARRAEAAQLRLIVEISKNISRLPDMEARILAGTGGIALPVIKADPFELSAPAKLRYGVRSILSGHFAALRQDGPED